METDWREGVIRVTPSCLIHVVVSVVRLNGSVLDVVSNEFFKTGVS